MLLSFGLIFTIGLFFARIAEKVGFPRIIGLLGAGIFLGPYLLNLLSPDVLNISAELRQIALIIILIKAGLSLNLTDLKKVGRPATLMAFLPACFEILAYLILAPLFFDLSFQEAAVMGAVLAAVSPAVVVPRMVHLIENHWGTKDGVPQLILAGASCDDIFVIVLFSSFLSMAQSGRLDWISLLDIPLAVGLGILLGVCAGFAAYKVMNRQFISPAIQTISLLSISFILMSIETIMKDTIAFSGLLAIMSMALIYHQKMPRKNSERLTHQFGQIWIGAEILLFVLVGSVVDIPYALNAGPKAIALILAALIVRSIGVWISLAGSKLTQRERVFCVIAYLPKATVQAAIGAVPLAAGLPSGQLILSVAVLGILITAPLGAIGIEKSYQRFLTHDNSN